MQAIMMQIMGNPVSCWELTAHASRTIVALGYHHIDKPMPESDSESEIYALVGQCAFLDSIMSLLLLRPRSLPQLPVKASYLLRADPASPMSILEMLPVLDKILDLTLDTKPSPTILNDEVAQLRTKMKDIYELMEKERQMHLLDSRTDALIHWKSMEFRYFSTLTSVHRLSPTVTTNPLEREECLQSRGSIIAFTCLAFVFLVMRSVRLCCAIETFTSQELVAMLVSCLGNGLLITPWHINMRVRALQCFCGVHQIN
jgi:hypothetical protein